MSSYSLVWEQEHLALHPQLDSWLTSGEWMWAWLVQGTATACLTCPLLAFPVSTYPSTLCDASQQQASAVCIRGNPCRRGLWVVGHSETLSKNPAWKGLVSHARSQKCLFAALPPYTQILTASQNALLAGAHNQGENALQARFSQPLKRTDAALPDGQIPSFLLIYSRSIYSLLEVKHWHGCGSILMAEFRKYGYEIGWCSDLESRLMEIDISGVSCGIKGCDSRENSLLLTSL